MKRFALYMSCLFLLFATSSVSAQHSIIPAPVSYQPGSGYFILNQQVGIDAPDVSLGVLASWLSQRLAASGIALVDKENELPERLIVLKLLPTPNATLGNEGYTLSVTSAGIQIEANKPAGIFYGMQSMLQLLPASVEAKAAASASYAIAACTITDYPRFGWRGLMLDVSRHFFTVAEVKQYIDLMAQYKLNVFHWHLTDDNGWRIEIKAYPRLTEIGGCRVERFGTFGERIAPKPGEKATDCGFYTQEQIKEVVAYATARHVTIVPEIDVPGHSLAAIAAYPELSVTKAPQMVSPGQKFSEWFGNGTFKMLLDNTLNPADEKVYTFLDKVFGEVADLFPGQYIHAGGDECYHGYWEKSPEVQQYMKAKGIKDVGGMQSHFINRVAAIIKSKGKTMIGWDEILEGGPLAKEAAVMSWRGNKGGIEAAKNGHYVVMSPTTHAYLDYMQADALLEPRVYAKLYLKTCYEFDPTPAGINAAFVLGGQGNLWTEKVPNIRHATYMTYPRSWALAEALWMEAGKRDWPDFVRRTETHFTRAEAAGIKVSKALYDVSMRSVKKGDQTLVEMTCDHPDAIIYYTIDGSFPDAFSPVYTKAFVLPDGPVTVHAVTYINGNRAGRYLRLSREELLTRK